MLSSVAGKGLALAVSSWAVEPLVGGIGLRFATSLRAYSYRMPNRRSKVRG